MTKETSINQIDFHKDTLLSENMRLNANDIEYLDSYLDTSYLSPVMSLDSIKCNDLVQSASIFLGKRSRYTESQDIYMEKKARIGNQCIVLTDADIAFLDSYDFS